MYSPPLYITTCHARDGVSDTPEHSNDIYLPSSSLIGDPDTVAWLRATRCTGTRPHRASQAAIACTPSLHRTPPFQAANTKALLVLSGRGAAVALVAARRDHLSLPFARASRADARTKTGVCARAVRAHPCPWILQATTMRRTAGIENKIRTRVGYVRYAKVILPQMRFRRANMVRMCENLGEHVRSGPEYACGAGSAR